MPRPTTKPDLIAAANDQWGKLWKLIDAIPGGGHTIIFDFRDNPSLKEGHWARDKNLRDVLIHLYEWHRLLLNWAAANLSGVHTSFLPKPYNWKNYGDMNAAFWRKHQATPYEEAVRILRESHGDVVALIESLTEQALFEKKHFTWTGTTNVGSYCISATVGHYDWAMKKIKQYMRENRS